MTVAGGFGVRFGFAGGVGFVGAGFVSFGFAGLGFGFASVGFGVGFAGTLVFVAGLRCFATPERYRYAGAQRSPPVQASPEFSGSTAVRARGTCTTDQLSRALGVR